MRSSIAVITACLIVLITDSSASARIRASQDHDKAIGIDPATNPILAKFSEHLPQADEQRARTIRLALTLASSCQGTMLNQILLKREIGRFEARPADDRTRAITLTKSHFNYLDTDAIAHLCAGVSYLFGPSGRMLRGLMSPGSGELAPLHHAYTFHIVIPRELLGN